MLAVVAASTLDYIAGEVRLGGPAYYIGTAFLYLESRALLVTTRSLVSRYLSKLSHFLDVAEAGYGETIFKIEVCRDGSRVLSVLRQSRFEIETLAKAVGGYNSVLISTTYGELNPEDLVNLVEGREVVIDVQGFVRRTDKDGMVFQEPRRVFEVERSLRKSRRRVLRGEREEFPRKCWVDPLKCAEELRSDIVITSGEKPFKVSSYEDMCLYEVEPPQGFYGEPVGLGDVFTAVLTYYLFIEKLEFLDAVTIASAAAALKLRNKHPWFTIQELDSLKKKVGINRKTCY